MATTSPFNTLAGQNAPLLTGAMNTSSGFGGDALVAPTIPLAQMPTMSPLTTTPKSITAPVTPAVITAAPAMKDLSNIKTNVANVDASVAAQQQAKTQNQAITATNNQNQQALTNSTNQTNALSGINSALGGG